MNKIKRINGLTGLKTKEAVSFGHDLGETP